MTYLDELEKAIVLEQRFLASVDLDKARAKAKARRIKQGEKTDATTNP